jgi:hypothetical protein
VDYRSSGNGGRRGGDLNWYISACSNSVQYVRLHPILMSILLYYYMELTQCISEVERIEAIVNSKKKGGWWQQLTAKKKEEETEKEEEAMPTTMLDSYFVKTRYSLLAPDFGLSTLRCFNHRKFYYNNRIPRCCKLYGISYSFI